MMTKRGSSQWEALEHLGIVQELAARKRNRLFCYSRYLEVMNRDMELPER